ncbi:MAG: hypothetical protein FJY11_07735 [Bacteroidetes bacterium]|nr:hypothetical protein [Bacteroidota bacterium]
MKKTSIAFLVALLVLATSTWFMSSSGSLPAAEWIQYLVILVLVIFGLWFAFRRLGSARRNEPVEDEMSKRIMTKASSLSYFISLYIWVAVIYIKDRVNIDTEVLIGSGILAMAVVFAVIWVIIYLRGQRNE